jgi:predicted ABC-type sugar transport system permease subunit
MARSNQGSNGRIRRVAVSAGSLVVAAGVLVVSFKIDQRAGVIAAGVYLIAGIGSILGFVRRRRSGAG